MTIMFRRSIFGIAKYFRCRHLPNIKRHGQRGAAEWTTGQLTGKHTATNGIGGQIEIGGSGGGGGGGGGAFHCAGAAGGITQVSDGAS
jgi:hypothetical protein